MQADRHLIEGSYFKAVNAYKKAIAAGLINASSYRNYSMALYQCRMVDDAINAMSKAVRLSPNSDLYRLELGIFYVAKDQLTLAQKQLLIALKSNPGLAEAYYFLGETFYKLKKYDLAWYAARTAEKLGFDILVLEEKLSSESTPPELFPWQHENDKLAYRMISFEKRNEAETFLQIVKEGKLFEYVQGTPDGTLGGYAGEFDSSQLPPQLAAAVKARKPFSEPII